MMKVPDKRCCGSGVCIINDAGECWCGQVWDGEKMSAPSLNLQTAINKNQDQDSAKPKPHLKSLVLGRHYCNIFPRFTLLKPLFYSTLSFKYYLKRK